MKIYLVLFSIFISTIAKSTPSEEVIEVPGRYSIDSNGSFSYKIPIETPASVNGIEPRLSLQYRSNSADGVAGDFWHLAGISSISRCPSTMYEDGVIRNVKFDYSDRFCLGSSKLYAISGEYGQDGTEYRVQNDRSIKVVSFGQIGSGPSFFRVFLKDGLVREYGNYSGSYFVGKSDTVYSWKISKLSDRIGNEVNYKWTQTADASEIKLDEVSYGGNSRLNKPATKKIEFEYQDVKAARLRYIAGQKLTRSSAIKVIRVFNYGVFETRYDLEYDFPDSQRRTLLRSVTRCISSTSTCSEPTSISWSGELQSGVGRIESDTKNLFGVSVHPNSRNPRHVIDVDGDGWNDILMFTREGVFVSKGSPSGFLKASKWTAGFNEPHWEKYRRFRTLTDVDRDGFLDIVGVGEKGIHLARGQADSFAPVEVVPSVVRTSNSFIDSKTPILFSDLNNDGFVDVTIINKNGVYVSLSNTKPFDTKPVKISEPIGRYSDWQNGISHLKTIDIDGDGFRDVVGMTPQGTIYLPNSADGFGKTKVYTRHFSPWMGKWDTETDYIRYVDINADGLPDMVGVKNGDLYVGVNNGLTVLKPEIWYKDADIQKWLKKENQFKIADLNRDGIVDLVGIGEDGLFVAAGYGDLDAGGFSKFKIWNSRLNSKIFPQTKYPLRIADIDGTGSFDVVGFNNDTFFTAKNLAEKIYVEQIVSGFGKGVRIEFDHLTNESTYSSGGVSVFPLVTYRGPLSVVSKVKESNGIGGYTQFTYKYESLKFHSGMFGQGSLGFSKRTELNSATGIKKEYFYSQETANNLAGTLESVKTYRSDGRLFSIEESIWDSLGNLYPAKTGLFENIVRTKRKTLFNEDGFVSYITEDEYDYDEYSNVVSHRSETAEGPRNTIVTTTTEYLKNPATWSIGLPTKTTVTYQDNTNDVVIRTQENTYNSEDLVVGVVQNRGTTVQRDTVIAYNDIGLKTSEVISWTPAESKGLGFTSINKSWEYDAEGRLIKSIDPVGLFKEYQYFQNTDLVSTSRDERGLETVYLYDRWKRKISETDPAGIIKTSEHIKCQSSCLQNGVFQKVTTESGKSDIVQTVDSLGRVVQVKYKGKHNQDIVEDTSYGTNLEISTKSDPYFVGDEKITTEYFYDDLKRRTLVKRTDEYLKSFTYNGLVTQEVDPRGNGKTIVTNHAGIVLSVTDAENNTTLYSLTPDGKTKTITDALGNVTSFKYDLLRRKVEHADPNSGTSLFEYNAFGKVYKETFNTGKFNTYEYDKIGRKTRDVLDGGSTNQRVFQYSYHQNGINAGLLQNVLSNQYSEMYTYDALSRLVDKTHIIEGTLAQTLFSYDSLNRLSEKNHPDGTVVEYIYDQNSFLQEVRDKVTGQLYEKGVEADAYLRTTKTLLGNGINVVKDWSKVFQTVNSIQNIKSDGNELLSFSYKYDKANNVTERNVTTHELYEEFTYDNLDRLITFKNNIGEDVTFTYDATGNMLSRSDVGVYEYGQTCNGIRAGPHAVSKITIPSGEFADYCYDASGNQTVGYNRNVTYNSINKPSLIENSASSTAYIYNQNYTRYKRVDTDKSTNEVVSTYFLDDLVVVEKDGVLEFRLYVGSHTIISTKDGTKTEKYILKDHLGSANAVTDTSEAMIDLAYFDPWGKKISYSNGFWNKKIIKNDLSDHTLKGFTSHEQIDNFSLVHMGGRVYDPLIGRMLSPDPFLSDFTDNQSHNGYSYVRNSPLSFVDPTGYFPAEMATLGNDKEFKSDSYDSDPDDSGIPFDDVDHQNSGNNSVEEVIKSPGYSGQNENRTLKNMNTTGVGQKVGSENGFRISISQINDTVGRVYVSIKTVVQDEEFLERSNEFLEATKTPLDYAIEEAEEFVKSEFCESAACDTAVEVTFAVGEMVITRNPRRALQKGVKYLITQTAKKSIKNARKKAIIRRSRKFPLRKGKKEYYVYEAYRDNERVYVGISKNPKSRAKDHAKLGRNDMVVLNEGKPMTKNAARTTEQAIIVRNPHYENVRNSIWPGHDYYEKMVSYGESILKKLGYK